MRVKDEQDDDNYHLFVDPNTQGKNIEMKFQFSKLQDTTIKELSEESNQSFISDNHPFDSDNDESDITVKYFVKTPKMKYEDESIVKKVDFGSTPIEMPSIVKIQSLEISKPQNSEDGSLSYRNGLSYLMIRPFSGQKKNEVKKCSKLPLEYFMENQYQELSRLNLQSHKNQFFDKNSNLYDFDEIKKWIQKQEKKVQQASTFLQSSEDTEIKDDWNTLAMKMDAHIRNTSLKDFESIFKFLHNPQPKKYNYEFNIKNGSIQRDSKEQKAERRFSTMMTSLTNCISDLNLSNNHTNVNKMTCLNLGNKGAGQNLALNLNPQNIISAPAQFLKKDTLKLVIKKQNNEISFEIINTLNFPVTLVVSQNLNLTLKLYNSIADIVQEMKPQTFELSKSVSTNFDARNKVFKVFQDSLYIFKVQEKLVNFMKIDLKTSQQTVLDQVSTSNLQAILFLQDIDTKEIVNEKEFLNNLSICVIENKSYYVNSYKQWSQNDKQKEVKHYNFKNQALLLVQSYQNDQLQYLEEKDQEPIIFKRHGESSLIAQVQFQEKVKELIEKKVLNVFIDIKSTFCSSALPYEDQVEIQQKVFGIENLKNEGYENIIIHKVKERQSYLLKYKQTSIQIINLKHEITKHQNTKELSYITIHDEKMESPYQIMLQGKRDQQGVFMQFSKLFNNIFISEDHQTLYEVAQDQFKKNKIVDYKSSKIPVELQDDTRNTSLRKQGSLSRFSFSPIRKLKSLDKSFNRSFSLNAKQFQDDDQKENVLTVLPFHDKLEDMNIIGINWELMCLTNYHQGKFTDIQTQKWLPIQSESLYRTNMQKIEERKKILQIALSSKITLDAKGSFIQNFQVLQVTQCPKDSKFKWFNIKEFQYCVKGNSPMISLIGQKLIFLNQHINYDVEFVPLNETERALITGTCLIFKHKLQNGKAFKQLPLYNFKEKDYQFRNKISNSGYIRVCEDGNEQDCALIIGSKLNHHITEQSMKSSIHLFQSERLVILQNQLKVLINMIPVFSLYRLVNAGPKTEICFDFFQPIEVLKSKCRANYYLRSEKQLMEQVGLIKKKQINPDNLEESLIVHFIQKCGESPHDSTILQSLEEQGWIREPFEIINDINCQNVIEDSMDFEKNELVFKILFEHAFNQQQSKETYDIFIRTLHKAFSTKPTFQSIFTDMVNDNDDYSSNFSISIVLDNTNLPKYSGVDQSLHDFQPSDEINVKEMENLKDYQGYPKDYSRQELIGIHTQFLDDFSELGIIPVEHFVIDFRSILLNEKLKRVKGLATSDEIQFTEFDFAKLIYQINTKFQHDIEEQNCIRALIDFQFEKTQRFYHKMFLTYMFCFVVPFILQLLFISNPKYVQLCLAICCVRQTISLLMEVIQIQAFRKKYFLDIQTTGKFRIGFPNIFNITNLLCILCFFCYCYCKFSTPFTTLGAHGTLNHTTMLRGFSDYDKMVNLFLVAVTLQIVLACNYYMQVYRSFGILRTLIILCLWDIAPFSVYMCMYLLMFAVMFKVLGVNIKADNYPGMNDFGMQFMNTFENSIGNVMNPDLNIWITSDNPSQIMVSLIYFIWFANQFLATIVLINFLIAVISQSYENVMNRLMVHIYHNRAKMNFSYYQIMKFYNYCDRLTLVLLQSKQKGFETHENLSNDEWKGFTQTIKKFLHQKISPLENKVNEVKAHLNEVDVKMKSLEDGQGKIQNTLETILKAIEVKKFGQGSRVESEYDDN